MQEEAVERVAKAPELSPMETSDAEDAIADWLDEHGIDGRLGPGADAGRRPASTPTGLSQVADIVGTDCLEGAVRWLTYTVETELLMDEIEDSTGRISHLVGAAKQYSQLDRAPYQEVDVHDLLDSTLLMLGAQDRPGHHGGQGLRPDAAQDPRVRGRAQPGLDEPDRQRRLRHGRSTAG